MSANHPIELPGVVSGEYVELDVDLFLKAFSTIVLVMTGEMPCAEGFIPGPLAVVEGLPTLVVEDTPFTRGTHTAISLFPHVAQRLSFLWRAVVVMDIAMDKKYSSYRNDNDGTMHIALATAVATVRGSERTTEDELRASFDRMFRTLLETTRSDGKFPTA
jgi:hypothetical protein